MNAALLGVAQAACNRALALDPERDRILHPLAGRRIGVQVTGPTSLEVLVTFTHEGVSLAPGSADADATVSGTPQALLSLLSGGDGLPAARGVQVRGDMGVLETLSAAIAQLRPDWHEPLSRLMGDELGHPLARGLDHAVALVTRTARELHADTAEYLREESGLLVSASELREFAGQVDSLRDAVERLEKRVDLLSPGS